MNIDPGKIAYQLTLRLVIDMPTARAAVDAAIKECEKEAAEANKPKCCVCETTEGLFQDGRYGWRCRSDDCMVF